MRIKRFTAPDMRTALRMVRDEQGPDAVILSNRPCEDGVEVVCATDYDEALVQQALRAAAPKMPASREAAAMPPAAPAQAVDGPVPQPPRAAAATPKAASTPSVRGSLADRARAVFRIGDSPAPGPETEPTLAELTAEARGAGDTQDRPSRADKKGVQPPPSRFDEMMAALNPATLDTDAAAPGIAEDIAEPTPAAPLSPPAQSRPAGPHPVEPTPAAEVVPAATASASVESAVAPHHSPATGSAPAAKLELSLEPLPELDEKPEAAGPPKLEVVPRWDADPTVAAMREELAAMRQLIEREMGQFTIERLRGSPARAAAFDLLLGYGCDDSLAQDLAARIDPALDPDKVRAPMLAELARLLRIRRDEPIEDGGVIALIGPTGAGKTTTAAKLAARFAARHRARDVALVTTDGERVGAHEQLHAHGRKLGITVSEAHGPEGLAQTLEQLQDYPLVIVDTAGFGARDRALLGQVTWLRATRNVRSLLVLPANANPHDMHEVVRRYRMASPEGVILTKLDETGRLGSALSVVLRSDLPLAYTTHGQHVATDLSAADASHLVLQLEKLRRAADNPLATEDRHVVA